MPLKAGEKAPDFALKDQSGITRKNKDVIGKILVLFFYPKDDTPGCTIEACSFRDNYADFTKLDAEIWGVSSDSESSHKLFSERYKLPFPLLSDQDNSLRKLFKVSNILGVIPNRTTFIINKEGNIYQVFNNLLDGAAHVREASKFIKELNSIK